MNVATFEGIVENGQIKLPKNVRVPERTKVYVVIPGIGLPGALRLMSPRLAHPEQAKDFNMTIIPNFGVQRTKAAVGAAMVEQQNPELPQLRRSPNYRPSPGGLGSP